VQELQKLKIFDNKQLSFLSDNKDSVGSATRRDERRERERELQRDLNLQPTALAKCSKMGVRFIRVNRCLENQEGAQEST
jgi:hypothetical protein